ncbi:hypothetical protein BDR04DRAFT_1094291 [Suillus decipiens]|nr:hypothetical protein BDR04DRAFT_1094291 [Suillus decipiens]
MDPKIPATTLSISLPLAQPTNPYPRRRVPVAGAKEVLELDGTMLDASHMGFASLSVR